MATQIGRNWSSGDIVTAANLSSIEGGVSTLVEGYTPTAWANGDTVTAASLNKIEQGIVDGGSSDFSTAKLTYAGIETIYISRIFDDGVIKGVTPVIAEAGTYDVVLYNGVAYGELDRVLGNVSVDGAIEYDDGGVTITGDCTITISDSSSGGAIL